MNEPITTPFITVMRHDVEKLGQARWRYQPVVVDDEFIMLCECYFDINDRLVSWETEPGPPAAGMTVPELIVDLALMLAATRHWQPVRFEDLRVGMAFERTTKDDQGFTADLRDFLSQRHDLKAISGSKIGERFVARIAELVNDD